MVTLWILPKVECLVDLKSSGRAVENDPNSNVGTNDSNDGDITIRILSLAGPESCMRHSILVLFHSARV